MVALRLDREGDFYEEHECRVHDTSHWVPTQRAAVHSCLHRRVWCSRQRAAPMNKEYMPGGIGRRVLLYSTNTYRKSAKYQQRYATDNDVPSVAADCA